jgi:GGDEF domain-containing protein
VRTRPTILYFGPVEQPVPELLRRWADNKGFPLLVLDRREEVESIVLRGHPSLLVVNGERMNASARELVVALKADPFSAIVPVTILEGAHDPDAMQQWFAAGADEILTAVFPPDEQRARLDAMLVRTQRDVAVHPSTRMPGTTEIEREIRRQLEMGGEFAVCYADLDHFKEFNDRYSYYDGDRVIYLLSRILHDVVKGMQGTRGSSATSEATTSSSFSPPRAWTRCALRFSTSSTRWCRCSTTNRTAGQAIFSGRIGEDSCTGCRS